MFDETGMNTVNLEKYKLQLGSIDTYKYTGHVKKIVGLNIESLGPIADIGEVCNVYERKGNNYIKAEVVGFRDNRIFLMPYDELGGVGIGSRVESTNKPLMVSLGPSLAGRILDGLGNPIDNKGPVMVEKLEKTENPPPAPLSRKRITAPLYLGIKAIDSLLTCGEGQRIGIFSGSGVGKSTLLGMIARNCQADINVIALIGERGREVREFIEKDLKESGLEKSVVIVATSDKPAIIRVKAANVATTIAEYFRSKGLKVMFMMDSITRYAMAQREIGIAIGEAPVARGYTPSVFSKLPKLLERTGFSSESSITAIYTVLVEGDEMNEPVSDTVRGILDGHVVLSRRLASLNIYPAIDVNLSVSRIMPDIVSKEHRKCASRLKDIIASYNEAKDIINIGAYKKGSNANVDFAIDNLSSINKFLCQDINEKFDFSSTEKMMFEIMEN